MGKPEYQTLTFKNKFVNAGLSKDKYSNMLNILFNEFNISLYQFRELNIDDNEHLNLFEHCPVKEKRIFHGFWYIRTINLSSYEFFMTKNQSLCFNMAQILDPIWYRLPTVGFLRPNKNEKGMEKVKSSKFEQVGCISFSEKGVPSEFVKYIFENTVSNVNWIRIPCHPFLEYLTDISETLEDGLEELEILSYSIKFPGGNYLSSIVRKFPNLLTLSLNTPFDMLVESILELLPNKSRAEEESKSSKALPPKLNTFKFGAKLKNAKVIETVQTEVLILVRK